MPECLPRIRRGLGIGRWLKKGLWAVTDQGLFATSNFVLNIFLARWLTPVEYGAFSTAFAIFLLVGGLYTATIIEPMLVFGPGRYEGRLPEYLGALVYGHLGFSALGSFALLLASLGFALWGVMSLSTVLLALALAEPFILLLWLMRRACYARLEPHLAVSGGAWYMLLMLAGAYLVYRFGWLSTATALGVMAISSLAVSLWLAVRLRVKQPSLRRGELARDALNNHWIYGRWSVANKGLSWVPHNIFYLLLPIWWGLEASASFKALMNLLMPMLQANSALSVLLLPTLVRARDHSNFNSSIRLALVPFVLAPALYWVLLGAFHSPLVSLLYGGRYTEYAHLFWLLGLVPVVAAIKEVMSQSLRALERPDWLFWAYAVSAVVAGTLGAWCVYVWGVVGAGAGLLFTQGIAAVLVTALLVILRRRTSEGLVSARGGREAG
jgi:O-antigen/teichoic acid export membrane protein